MRLPPSQYNGGFNVLVDGVTLFSVPGRGQEVENAVEDKLQVCMSLIHQQHHGVAAGRAHGGAVAAALRPQSVQRRALTHKEAPCVSVSQLISVHNSKNVSTLSVCRSLALSGSLDEAEGILGKRSRTHLSGGLADLSF